MSKPTNFSIEESLEVVWAALHQYQDDRAEEIPAAIITEQECEEGWDDITLAMAWITEALEADKPMTGDELLATHKYTGQSALDLD